MNSFISLAEYGWAPDVLIRMGIRKLVAQRLRSISKCSLEQIQSNKSELIHQLIHSPLAIETEKANEQHYELPASFFELVLGKHKKYSACLYQDESFTLDQAEENMLQLYCERGQIHDGMEVLELGCGWGSLTLWLAERYPSSRITGVSNSNSQREFILEQCKKRGLHNVTILTCDINDFEIVQQFDRVISIEMFEHLRNYQLLFQRIASWLKKDGKLFFHIFTHKEMPYLFEVKNRNDWMSQYFFTGGMMPSHDLPLYFQQDLTLENHWAIDGSHYEQTSNHWLENLDRNKSTVLKIFSSVYGEKNEIVWFNRWRIFFMACAELFGYRNGQEWLVSHFLFKKVRDC